MQTADYDRNLKFITDGGFIIESRERCAALTSHIRKAVEGRVNCQIKNAASKKGERGIGIRERIKCWKILCCILKDLDIIKHQLGSTDNQCWNRILIEFGRGNYPDQAPALLAWICYYDLDAAEEFYAKTGLAEYAKASFRKYVGQPGDWSAARDRLQAEERRKRAHGIRVESSEQSLSEVSTPQPRLSPVRLHEHWAHYSNRKIDILGRDAEQAALREFADTTPGFRWLQLAGEGGQGKSCLAQDLIEYQKTLGWEAGFLLDTDRQAFADHWRNWQSEKHHLIVFDYVIGAAEDIGRIMHTLAARCDEFEQRGVSVRVLLLERQPWNKGALSAGSASARNRDGQHGMSFTTNRALWFESVQGTKASHDLAALVFVDSRHVIEIKALDQDDLVEIVKQIHQEAGLPLAHSADFVKNALLKIDGSGRPLYAHFLASALIDGAFRQGWDRHDLLQWALDRERTHRWADMFDGPVPALDDDHPAFQVAAIATMIGGGDFRQICREIEVAPSGSKIRRQALAVVDAPMEGGSLGSPAQIAALEPDILGEYFVVKFLAQQMYPQRIIQAAWRMQPLAVAAFLVRAAQDFPAEEGLHDALNCVPLEDAGLASYFMASATIISVLMDAGVDIPAELISAVKRLADSDDPIAMNNLGIMIVNGVVPDSDFTNAVHLFARSAQNGESDAAYNLAYCYQEGVGINPDIHRAIHFYEEAVLIATRPQKSL